VKTVHEKKQITLACPHQSCKAVFTCEKGLIAHCKNHGDPRSFSCELCNVSFAKKTRYLQHKLIHTGVVSFQCSICNSSFPNKSKLNRHLRSHNSVQCDYPECKFTVDNKNLLRKHYHMSHRLSKCVYLPIYPLNSCLAPDKTNGRMFMKYLHEPFFKMFLFVDCLEALRLVDNRITHQDMPTLNYCILYVILRPNEGS